MEKILDRLGWANETDMLHSSILLWSETKNQELEQFRCSQHLLGRAST